MTSLAINDEIEAFSDDVITAAARLYSEGVSENSVVLATGLDSHELAVLRQDPRYKAKASELASMIQVEDLGLDTGWGGVEAEALAQLQAELAVSGSEMSAMEKLAIATKANAAKRRHGVLAERGRGQGGAGVLDAGNGGTQIINLTMPTVLVERMQNINRSNAVVVEHEKKAQDEFEANDLNAVSLEDVQQIFDVELGEDNEAQSVGIDGIFSGMYTDMDVSNIENMDEDEKGKLAAAGIATSYG